MMLRQLLVSSRMLKMAMSKAKQNREMTKCLILENLRIVADRGSVEADLQEVKISIMEDALSKIFSLP
ncbi:hypothetical protein TURU_157406 [Turdus rufiventris]|nr:hypothetical protein TURU_157406 [Turdus rufiventris]